MTKCELYFQQGVVSLTFKGLKHMRKDEGGSGGTIINISSTAALYNVPYVPTYSGCKAAVLHFSSCIAVKCSYWLIYLVGWDKLFNSTNSKSNLGEFLGDDIRI